MTAIYSKLDLDMVKAAIKLFLDYFEAAVLMFWMMSFWFLEASSYLILMNGWSAKLSANAV